MENQTEYAKSNHEREWIHGILLRCGRSDSRSLGLFNAKAFAPATTAVIRALFQLDETQTCSCVAARMLCPVNYNLRSMEKFRQVKSQRDCPFRGVGRYGVCPHPASVFDERCTAGSCGGDPSWANVLVEWRDVINAQLIHMAAPFFDCPHHAQWGKCRFKDGCWGKGCPPQTCQQYFDRSAEGVEAFCHRGTDHPSCLREHNPRVRWSVQTAFAHSNAIFRTLEQLAKTCRACLTCGTLLDVTFDTADRIPCYTCGVTFAADQLQERLNMFDRPRFINRLSYGELITLTWRYNSTKGTQNITLPYYTMRECRDFVIECARDPEHAFLSQSDLSARHALYEPVRTFAVEAMLLIKFVNLQEELHHRHASERFRLGKTFRLHKLFPEEFLRKLFLAATGQKRWDESLVRRRLLAKALVDWQTEGRRKHPAGVVESVLTLILRLIRHRASHDRTQVREMWQLRNMVYSLFLTRQNFVNFSRALWLAVLRVGDPADEFGGAHSETSAFAGKSLIGIHASCIGDLARVQGGVLEDPVQVAGEHLALESELISFNSVLNLVTEVMDTDGSILTMEMRDAFFRANGRRPGRHVFPFHYLEDLIAAAIGETWDNLRPKQDIFAQMLMELASSDGEVNLSYAETAALAFLKGIRNCSLHDRTRTYTLGRLYAQVVAFFGSVAAFRSLVHMMQRYIAMLYCTHYEIIMDAENQHDS